MKRIYMAIITVGFSLGLFSEPNGNVSLQDSSIKHEVSNIILDSYCDAYYIKLEVPYPSPIIEYTWEASCSNGNTVISEWVFPDDALFLETPYLYRRIVFDTMPTHCTIIIDRGNGGMSKTFTVFADGSIAEGIVSI